MHNYLLRENKEPVANISYSLYLVHILVIPIVLNTVITNAGLFNLNKSQIILTSLIISLLVCFCVCYLLYRFIEKPFIYLGKRLIDNMMSEKNQIKKEEMIIGVN